MKISIINIGKIKDSFIHNAILEYEKRINKFTKFELVQIKEFNFSNDIDKTLESEAKLINEWLEKNKPYTIVMDIKGSKVNSEELASKIDKIFSIKNHICFIIGSSHGLSESVKSKADLKLSFSDLTFPHQLFIVVLMEQIYRSFTILKNIEYHK